MSHLVLPLFKYPPFTGVASNRWFHLSHKLSKKYPLTVYTPPRLSFSRFTTPPFVEYVPCDPLYLLHELSFGVPLLNSLKNYLVSKIFQDFYPVDYAQYWFNFFAEIVDSHVSAGSLFILTGAPFSFQLFFASYLISIKYPRFILDFRDPFVTDLSRHFRSPSLASYYSELEKRVLSSHLGQRVFVTSALALSMATEPFNCTVIENGHPFENICSTKKCSRGSSSIVYFGTMSNGRDDIFIEFLLTARNLSLIDHIVIYGRCSIKLCRFIQNISLPFPVTIKKSVSQKHMPQIAVEFDLALQVNSDWYPYLVSTKIYEYPALGLPVLCLASKSSLILDLIQSAGIGASLSPPFSEDSVTQAILKSTESPPDNLSKFALDTSWSSRASEYSLLIDSVLSC